MDKLTPSSFLLTNSKGRPDFIMTMLVVVILALLATLVIWLGLNSLALLANAGELDEWQAESLVKLMDSFNANAQLIIIGICSSVFTLAGTYYLRRSAYDKHHEERKNRKMKERQLAQTEVSSPLSFVNIGFAENEQSTVSHPNYDDEEEDI